MPFPRGGTRAAGRPAPRTRAKFPEVRRKGRPGNTAGARSGSPRPGAAKESGSPDVSEAVEIAIAAVLRRSLRRCSLLIGFTIAAVRPAGGSPASRWIVLSRARRDHGDGARSGSAASLRGAAGHQRCASIPSTEPLLPAGRPLPGDLRPRRSGELRRGRGLRDRAWKPSDGVFTNARARQTLKRGQRRASSHFPEVRQRPEPDRRSGLPVRRRGRLDRGAPTSWRRSCPRIDEALRADPRGRGARPRSAVPEARSISDDGRTAAVNVTFRKISPISRVHRLPGRRARRWPSSSPSSSAPAIRFFVAGRSARQGQRLPPDDPRSCSLMIPAALVGVVALGLLAWCSATRRGVRDPHRHVIADRDGLDLCRDRLARPTPHRC